MTSRTMQLFYLDKPKWLALHGLLKRKGVVEIVNDISCLLYSDIIPQLRLIRAHGIVSYIIFKARNKMLLMYTVDLKIN